MSAPWPWFDLVGLAAGMSADDPAGLRIDDHGLDTLGTGRLDKDARLAFIDIHTRVKRFATRLLLRGGNRLRQGNRRSLQRRLLTRLVMARGEARHSYPEDDNAREQNGHTMSHHFRSPRANHAQANRLTQRAL